MILWFLVAVVLHVYNLSFVWWVAWFIAGVLKATIWWYEVFERSEREHKERIRRTQGGR